MIASDFLPALRRSELLSLAGLRRWLPVMVMAMTWQSLASLWHNPRLPAPLLVAQTLLGETLHGPLLFHLGITLARVALCFTLAMGLGTAIGIAMGRSERINHWLEPWLQLLLTLPAMVVAILLYIWLGLNEGAAILAVTLSKLPNVVVILREGQRRHDRDLAEMAQALRFPPRVLLFELWLPELAPFLLAAARSGLSLVWKIVLLVELLGRSNGIGFQLNVTFQLFDMSRLLAYSASFMLVILAIDSVILTRLDRYVARWQRH